MGQHEELFESVIDRRMAIDELLRELKMRERLYPRWILAGKISELDARFQIEWLKWVIDELKVDAPEADVVPRSRLNAVINELEEAKAKLRKVQLDAGNRIEELEAQVSELKV